MLVTLMLLNATYGNGWIDSLAVDVVATYHEAVAERRYGLRVGMDYDDVAKRLPGDEPSWCSTGPTLAGLYHYCKADLIIVYDVNRQIHAVYHPSRFQKAGMKKLWRPHADW
jgi:hypothetical protein